MAPRATKDIKFNDDETESLPPTVEMILVCAHSPNFCWYWLNGTDEKHKASRSKLFDYLITFAPELSVDLTSALQDLNTVFILTVGPPAVFQRLKRMPNLGKASERIGDDMKKGMLLSKRTQESNTGMEEFARLGKEMLLQNRREIHRLAVRQDTGRELPRWGER